MTRSLFPVMIIACSIIIEGVTPLHAGDTLRTWAYLLQGAPPRNLDEAIASYDSICITGLTLMADGTAIFTAGNLVARCRARKRPVSLQIYPLATANAGTAHRLLHDPLARKHAVKELRAILDRYDLAGLHLDLEYLPPADAPILAQFLRELKAALPDRSLSMAVFPSIDIPEKWHRFHDLSIIGPHLDGIVLMCYDRHRPDGAPGPVTSINWADASIKAALRHIDRRRLWLGIPAYGYAWPETGRGRVLTARQAASLTRHINSRRDESGTQYIEYDMAGRRYRAWVADRETRDALKNLARRHALAGTALWRLGFEE